MPWWLDNPRQNESHTKMKTERCHGQMHCSRAVTQCQNEAKKR